MSKYSYFELLKAQAKQISREEEIQLSLAQERLALQVGFKHFHELTTVARRHPSDPRLMQAALGDTDLKEVIYGSPVYESFGDAVDEMMEGWTADTNAYNYSCEDIDVESATYNESTGVLTLEVSLEYSGEQDQDRVYAGSAFYLKVILAMARRNGGWVIGEDFLTLRAMETDQDRDREAELEDQYADYLKDAMRFS